MLTFDHGAAALAPVAIAVPIVGAPLLIVAGRLAPRVVVDVASIAVTATVIGLVADLLATTSGGRVVTWSAGWNPHHGTSVGIVLVSDPVGAGAALVGSCLMLAALVYSARYMRSVHAHYHCLMLLFLAGIVGLSLTGDLFDMFGFFELMGAAAYGLTGMKVEAEASLQGALNFGIVNSLGAYVTLTGIALLYGRTGKLGLPDLGQALGHHRPDALVIGAFCLVLTGFLVKAAMVPFHFWLADAHAVAPAPVCVLFSGIMVPLGAYAAARIYWVVFAGSIPAGDVRRAFLVLGATTAVVGAVMALSQRHVKRLLGYATIAHTGLLLVAFGCLDAQGTAGAVLYVAGDAGVTAALFLVAGILLDVYDTMDEHQLYARARRLRLLGWVSLAAGLGVAALPPFGTALGAAASFEAGLALGYPWVPVLFVAVGALSGGAVLRVVARTFFGLGPLPRSEAASDARRTSGEDDEPDAPLHRAPWSMVAPAVLLVAGALAAGVVPGARAAADRAAAFFVDRSAYIAQALYGAPARTVVHAHANWTALGVGLDVLTAALALTVAAAALYGGPVLDRVPQLRRATVPVGVLRRLHSGRVGDYVAWLMLGIAVLAGFIGLPLR